MFSSWVDVHVWFNERVIGDGAYMHTTSVDDLLDIAGRLHPAVQVRIFGELGGTTFDNTLLTPDEFTSIVMDLAADAFSARTGLSREMYVYNLDYYGDDYDDFEYFDDEDIGPVEYSDAYGGRFLY